MPQSIPERDDHPVPPQREGGGFRLRKPTKPSAVIQPAPSIETIPPTIPVVKEVKHRSAVLLGRSNGSCAPGAGYVNQD